MNIVSIHQLSYLSWFGLLDKIIKSDVFIILDDVQFNKRAFQHRTLYSNYAIKPSYLTIPVNTKNHQFNNLLIKDVTIKDLNIIRKHFQSISRRYSKYEGFKKYKEEFEYIYNQEYRYIHDLNITLFNFMLKVFNINTKIIYSSTLNVSSYKFDRIIELVKKSNCSTYLSGVGAKEYMQDDLFKEHNIILNYQKFEHIYFEQYTKQNFQQGCFALELPFLHENYMEQLFNHYKSIKQLKLLKSINF